MDTDNTAGSTIAASKVEGTKVYNLQGDKLGSIDDLTIDKNTGKVRYAALEFGGVFGIGTDRYPVPWSMLKYDTTKDGFVADIDKSRLEGAPSYSEDTRPEYTDEYGRQIYGFYGKPWV